MLMLSRLFNLPQILPDHKLPALLKTEVLRVHKLAVQAAASSDAASDDSSSGDEMAEQKCTNCRKKRKEVRLLAAFVKACLHMLQLDSAQA